MSNSFELSEPFQALKRLTQNAYTEMVQIREQVEQIKEKQAAKRIPPFRTSSVPDTSRPAKAAWEGSVTYTAVASPGSASGLVQTGPAAQVRLEHRWPGGRGGAAATLASKDGAFSTGSFEVAKTEVSWRANGKGNLHLHLAGGKATPGDVLSQTDCTHGHGLQSDCALLRRGDASSSRALVGAAVMKGDVTVGLRVDAERETNVMAFSQALLKPSKASTLGLVMHKAVYKGGDGWQLGQNSQVAAHGSLALGDRVALSGWAHHTGVTGSGVQWNVSAASTETLSRWGWGMGFSGKANTEEINTEFVLRWRPGDGVSINPGVSCVLRHHERFEEPKFFLQMRWDMC